MTRTRPALEGLLRAVALVAAAVLLWYAVHALGARPVARAMGEVEAALARWTLQEEPQAVHAVFDSAPTPTERDWLAALGAAGTPATWAGTAPVPSAVTVEPVADPRRPSHVWVAAPAGAAVTLRDELGVLDSVTPARGGVRVVVPRLEGAATMQVENTEAAAAVRDSLVLRPVLVLGQAGWEAKFVLAALEERGWKVDARLAVAPSGDVRQGPAPKIDTAGYAAVIALDSVAARYAGAIRRYVTDGGGLLAVGEGAALRALAPVLPASVVAPPLPKAPFAGDTLPPRRSLALAPLGELEDGAVPLETRDSTLAAAAWRVGQGRVVQVGYLDTWRWRMAGANDESAEAHRAWWAALVSSVAYAPRIARPVTAPLEPTPFSSLVAALGPATVQPAATPSFFDDPRVAAIAFGVMLLALLAELASRRVRGLR